MTSPLLYQALFVRLSKRFALAFVLTLAIWLLLVAPGFTGWMIDADIPRVWIAPAAAALIAVGIVVALWSATAAYRALPPAPARWHRPANAVATGRPAGDRPLGRYRRIGIVLAGGGARGAYQAGALEALHRFLAERDALGRVTAIVGTSIGAWNALFWLAGHLERDAPTPLESWWRRIRLAEVVAPTFYLPAGRSHLLTASPWRRGYHALFADDDGARARLEEALAGQGPRFYFTRTSIDRARLEFATNGDGPSSGNRHPGRSRALAAPDRRSRPRSIEELESAVFAALDFPPLFESVEIGGRDYEDGGVIDNLPISLATDLAGCDLVFVLPLNAAFATREGVRDPLERLERVLTIRVGAAERRSLRSLALENELAALGDPARVPVASFAVCPDEPPLLDAIEFWRHREAARAYRTMRSATSRLLEAFDFDAPPGPVRLALVDADGGTRWIDDV